MGAIQAHHGLLFDSSGGSVAAGRWNPLDKHADIALTLSDTHAQNSVLNNWRSVRSVNSRSSGKWYSEFDVGGSATSDLIVGVATSAALLTTFIGAGATGWSMQNDASTTMRTNGVTTASGLTRPGTNQRFMVAYDAATGKIWLGAVGIWYNSGDPAAGTNATYTTSAGNTLFLAASLFATSGFAGETVIKNGASENLHTIPSGYSMWG